MDTFSIVWWQYPLLGIGALLFANGATVFNNLTKTGKSKILLLAQLTVSIIFLFYPLLRTF